MTEHPILMSGPMVRAIIEGRKTQTRRVVKWQGPKGFPHDFERAFTDNPAGIKRLMVPYHHPDDDYGDSAAWRHYPPYGDPGDRLWVRENGWERPERSTRDMREGADTWEPYYFDADITEADHEQFKEWGFKRRPSIHMPRAACRLVLELTDVRVERLQEISQQDVFAEGLHNAQQNEMEKQVGARLSPQDCYRYLWDSLNAKRAPWASNPWVWVPEFKRA